MASESNPSASRSGTARWQIGNVLGRTESGYHLWHFQRAGSAVERTGERAVAADQKLSTPLVQKGWRHLGRPRLNVAWLPAEDVFLRVLRARSEALGGAIDQELERAPIPSGQLVWGLQPLSDPAAPEQVCLLVMVARRAVEQFLDGLEDLGYLTDHLEVPCLLDLTTAPPPADGACVSVRAERDHLVCLVSWWQKGQLRSASLERLPASETAGGRLAAVVTQAAWAGEIEGWLPEDPAVTLRADPAVAALLEPALKECASRVHLEPPPSGDADLAELSAMAPSQANLLPEEAVARYRQLYIDRLWMRGLAAMALLYLLFVLGFMGCLRYFEYKKAGVDKAVAVLTPSYTNAVHLKARIQVLQDQLNLRFAALDCWKAASEALPEEMTLTSLAFQRGTKLVLFGTVPFDQQQKVSEFNETLSRARPVGEGRTEGLFSQVNTRSISGQAGRPATWSIECDLRKGEGQ